MERMNFVKDGVLRLPPGFRFHPTDEELVVQYLKRKVLSCPLPATIIPEVDVCKSDPWDLPEGLKGWVLCRSGDWEEERYFFSTREVKYPNGSRSNRATGSGYWKATGVDKQIAGAAAPGAPRTVVGMKKTLVFYRGKPPHGVRTDWIMHEYRLATQLPGDWVLCRVFLKKRSTGKTEEENVESVVDSFNLQSEGVKVEGGKKGMVYYDFMASDKKKNSPPFTGSTSSGSSGITDVSGNNDREESSSSDSFSKFL